MQNMQIWNKKYEGMECKISMNTAITNFKLVIFEYTNPYKKCLT